MIKEITRSWIGLDRPAAVSPWLRTAGIVLAGSLFAAVCSRVALPLWFTPVPLTLQPFAVLLLGLLLRPRLAGAALGLFLAEGAAGLPVFAPGVSLSLGMAHLLGPTGGFLLAYPAAGMLISFLWRRSAKGFTAGLICAALGDLLILACGALWLAAETHISNSTALTMAVIPFLPGDALKVATAAGIAAGFRRFRRAA